MQEQKLAFIGRTFKPIYNKDQQLSRIELDKYNVVCIDLSKKQHSFIISKSGGGKSYLAGVLVEEMIRLMENYAVVVVDPMGIFNTLKLANNTQEVTKWNEQVPGDVVAVGMDRCVIWVPSGDKEKFLQGTYDRVFALKASDFSYGTLCYAFDMDFLEPQVNLFRKCQAELRKERGQGYGLEQLIGHVREHGHELGFQVQTIEALITKLDALHELGIIDANAPEIHEMICEGNAAIFDVSQSSGYAAKVLVNFLAEKILSLRRQITRMVVQAKVDEQQIEKPGWYIPPVSLVIDEAHNYMQQNPVLKKCVKEGRNCGIMLTAISQSPDLTRDVYANITHLLVGPLIYDDDIAAVRAMLPIETSPKEFKQKIHKLTKGVFLYFNVDDKTEQLIKVRPRRTLHPAMTELDDERKYFKKKDRDESEPIPFAEDFPKLHEEAFSTLRRHDKGYEVGQVRNIVVKGTGVRGRVRILEKSFVTLPKLPDSFLMLDTATNSRAAAITKLNGFYPGNPILENEPLVLLRLEWVK
nr:DUF87 domain-containing protein [Candidatus Sigynarchaeota archaeon]